MAPLPATLFLGVGVLISTISLLVESVRIFIVVGIIFILIGILKIALKKKPVSHRTEYNTQPQETTIPLGTKRCFVCGAKNHTDANFCGHCGHKLS